jgi:hypothetical protein
MSAEPPFATMANATASASAKAGLVSYVVTVKAVIPEDLPDTARPSPEFASGRRTDAPMAGGTVVGSNRLSWLVPLRSIANVLAAL